MGFVAPAAAAAVAMLAALVADDVVGASFVWPGLLVPTLQRVAGEVEHHLSDLQMIALLDRVRCLGSLMRSPVLCLLLQKDEMHSHYRPVSAVLAH